MNIIAERYNEYKRLTYYYLKMKDFIMQDECGHLKEILEAQIEIIERHVDNHKWFMKINDRNEAIGDFIEKYGFIMREFYCSRICEERFICKTAIQYNPK